MSPLAESAGTAGYQNWRHLVFLHWKVPAEQLQRHLPPELSVETFDGSAWLGMVPFSMERVRPWWSPAVPGISWFLETNLRTYVRHQNGLSAVWFFSLDADSRIAVQVARTFWKLNYINCQMSLDFDAATHSIHYAGQRRATPEDRYEIQVQLPNQEPQAAAENTLEHFLLERYDLLTQTPAGAFMPPKVMHVPYESVPVQLLRCEESFTQRLIDHDADSTPPAHAVYSPGVDVRVTQLRPLET